MVKSERLLNLYLYLCSSRQPVTLDDIRTWVPGYKDKALEAVRQKLHRDKTEFKEKFGVNIIYHEDPSGQKKPGYTIDSMTLQPELNFTSEEAIALSILTMAVERSGVFPSSEALRGGVSKIAVDIPAEAIGASIAQPYLSIKNVVSAPHAGKIFNALLSAVKDKHVISFKYNAKSREMVGDFVAEPLAMLYCHSCWYCVAKTRPDSIIRKLNITRFESLPVPTGDTFVPVRLDKKALRQQDIWEWGGGDEYYVKIRLLAPKTSWLNSGLDTVIHRKQLNDGSVVADLAVRDMEAFLREFLKLGPDGQIMEPPEIIQQAVSLLEQGLKAMEAGYEF